MNKALLVLGIVAVAIPAYDELAGAVLLTQAKTAEGASNTNTLPFIWREPVSNIFPEIWLAILGAILILVAAFVPLG